MKEIAHSVFLKLFLPLALPKLFMFAETTMSFSGIEPQSEQRIFCGISVPSSQFFLPSPLFRSFLLHAQHVRTSTFLASGEDYPLDVSDLFFPASLAYTFYCYLMMCKYYPQNSAV